MINKIGKYFSFISYARYKHNAKIRKYQKQYANTTSHHSSFKRFFFIIFSMCVSIGIYLATDSSYQSPNDFEINSFIEGLKDNKSIFNLYQLIITAPIVFIIWFFRDQNKLKELHNARKNTNLAEFQKLQQWATGNIDGNKDNNQNAIALQISALHSLRNYLKGEFGDDFRRGAFEIFASTLHTQHQILLDECKINKTSIKEEIEKDKYKLTKQINRIAEEEWFNLLVNHSFPTATISLVGVNLKKAYLKHLDFGKIIDLSKSNLQEANLKSANLQEANLKSANLQEAYLKSANLQGANLMSANLQEAYLESANLQGAYLESANLQEAYLESANLQGAYLESANLQEAYLESANLQEAYLKSANLQEAYLESANLQGAFSSELTTFGFEKIINQQIGKQTDLEGTKNANLEGANIGSYTKEEAKKWIDEFNKATTYTDYTGGF